MAEPKSEFDYDFIVIGGGSAGYAAASTAAKAGLHTAVVEGGREVGGLCILRGCMPSKTLLATSARAAAVRGAAEFGVSARFDGVDGRKLQSRKQALIKDFADYRRGQLEAGRFSFLRGFARFRDASTIEIQFLDGQKATLRSRTFLVATGSRISTPSIPGLVDAGYLDSDAFLENESIPNSVVVLGGGAIALEAASFYAGIGTQVTLLQRSAQILRDADADVAEAATEGLRHQGIRIETNVHLESATKTSGGRVVRFNQNGESHEVTAEEIIYALGRSPATSELGLERAGVELEMQKICACGTQQTKQPHIFAAGDVCGPHEVVHFAIQQGEVAARNAVRLVHGKGETLEQTDDRLKLFAVFSEPGIAIAGLTEREAQKKGVPVLSASYPFADHGKSMVEGHLHGFVKLVVDAKHREILGAAVVGPQACELIHEVVVAMHFRSTAGQLARIPHYHPTLSEIWTYPAEDLA